MIRFIDVYKEYDNGTKALKGIDLRIDDGEFVFLVGPSGSGKSTIIKLITGEIALTQGKLMVNGYSLNNISPRQVPLMRRTRKLCTKIWPSPCGPSGPPAGT